MSILTVTWLISFSFQAMRIPGPQTQGLPKTIMGQPHQVLSSGGSILYPIQISQSGPSLMSGGPVVISQTGQQVPQPGSMIISHPGQDPSKGTSNGLQWSPKQTPTPRPWREIWLSTGDFLDWSSKLTVCLRIKQSKLHVYVFTVLSECTQRWIGLSECTSHLMAVLL